MTIDTDCITQIKENYYDRNGNIIRKNYEDPFFVSSEDGTKIVYDRGKSYILGMLQTLC